MCSFEDLPLPDSSLSFFSLQVQLLLWDRKEQLQPFLLTTNSIDFHLPSSTSRYILLSCPHTYCHAIIKRMTYMYHVLKYISTVHHECGRHAILILHNHKKVPVTITNLKFRMHIKGIHVPCWDLDKKNLLLVYVNMYTKYIFLCMQAKLKKNPIFILHSFDLYIWVNYSSINPQIVSTCFCHFQIIE